MMNDHKKEPDLFLYVSKVDAGFLSPGEDYKEKKLDLNEHLVPNPPATFFVRVSGDSMINVGIMPNSILVVDRSVTPTDGKIIIAIVNGDMTVKRYKKTDQATLLISENEKYSPIVIGKDMELNAWGVVTAVVTKV